MGVARDTLVLAAILVTVTFAGCMGDGTTASNGHDNDTERRWSTPQWKDALSGPVFNGWTRTTHYIESYDGTQLSLTLVLPEGLEPGSKIPTLLQITPYQAGRSDDSSFFGTSFSDAWIDYVERGAAYVEADARGTNGSEGCLDFGGSKDRSDARAFTDWVRAQDWSNGVIVTDGVSHPGMGSVVAHAADPNLTAALAHAPVVSYYQDQWLQGARLEQINEFYQYIEANPSAYLDPGSVQAQAAPCTGETLIQYGQVEGPFTELWDDRDLSRHTQAVDTPVLMTQGFVDLNVHADHVQLYWDSLPDDFPKHLVLGWWYHGWPDMDGHAAETFKDLRHRWLDATLFGTENGLQAEPRVLVEDSTGTWHESDDWPLAPSEHVVFNATADGELGPVAGDAGQVSYMDRNDVNRGRWEDAHVAFRTGPMDAQRMVNGAPVVHLVASSDQVETKWVAYLVDEAPDGSWQWVSHGYADSHSWGDEDEWLEIEPDTPYTWDIRLMPTAVVLEEGHRLTLIIASQDSALRNGELNGGFHCWDDHRGGCYNPTGIVPARTAGRATNTVHTGQGGTSVSFSWVDPGLTAKAPTP